MCASCDLATNSDAIRGGIRTLILWGLNIYPTRSDCPPHRHLLFCGRHTQRTHIHKQTFGFYIVNTLLVQ
jgi:hypothetical protein